MSLPSSTHGRLSLAVVLATILIAPALVVVADASGSVRPSTAAAASTPTSGEEDRCRPVITARHEAQRSLRALHRRSQVLERKLAALEAVSPRSDRDRRRLEREKKMLRHQARLVEQRRQDYRFRKHALVSSLRACRQGSPTTTGVGSVIHERLGIEAGRRSEITVAPAEVSEPMAASTLQWLTPGYAMGSPFDVQIRSLRRSVTISKVFDRPLPRGLGGTLLLFDPQLETWRVLRSHLSRDRTELTAVVPVSAGRSGRRIAGLNWCALSAPCVVVDLLTPEDSVADDVIDAYNDLGASVEESAADKIREWDAAHDDLLSRGIDALSGILPSRSDPPSCAQDDEEPVAGENVWKLPAWVKSVVLPGTQGSVGLPLLWCVGSEGDRVVFKTVNNRAYTVHVASRTDYLDDGTGLAGARIEGDSFFNGDVWKQWLSNANSVGSLETVADELVDRFGGGRMLLPGEEITHTFSREVVEAWAPGDRPLIRITNDLSDFVVGAILSEALDAAPDLNEVYGTVVFLTGCLDTIASLPESFSFSNIRFLHSVLADCVDGFSDLPGLDARVDDMVEVSVDPSTTSQESVVDLKKEVAAEVKDPQVRASWVELLYKALSYAEVFVDQRNYADPSYYEADAVAFSSACRPRVESVDWDLASGHPGGRVEINGSCFGKAPGDLADGDDLTAFLMLDNASRSNWHSCWAQDNPPDAVTCSISWRPRRIVLERFTGAYGSNGWRHEQGDEVVLHLWNSRVAQPSLAEAHTTCTIRPGGRDQTCG